MKFNFYKGSEKYLFETIKTFEGKTTEITWWHSMGKATTRYDATVRIDGLTEKKVGNVTFYVNLKLMLVILGV
jgi:hypothetical protein